MSPNRRQRPGFSRLDVGVALFIAVICMAFAVKAAVNGREKAHEVECANNLRQIGQAVLKFEQVNGFVPATASREVGDRRGWVPYLLPYLGQEQLAKKFKMDVDWYDAANAEAVATPLKVLQCPAAPQRTSAGDQDGAAWKGATGDYVAPESVNRRAIEALGLPATMERGALFGARGPKRLADVTDGLAQTIMVLECAGRPQAWRKGKRMDKDMEPEQGVWAGRRLEIEARGHLADGTGATGPCAVNCSNQHGLYSFHPRKAHVVFGDGSVRPLREGLNIYVFFALVTARGGELISPDDY